MFNGTRADGSVTLGAVLGYRVDDVAAVVTRVRDARGTATDPEERPYGLESACLDNQDVPFYLHQLFDSPTDDDGDLSDDRHHGDNAYVSLGVQAWLSPRSSTARCWDGRLRPVRMPKAARFKE
jgi:hypothetical protein